MFRRLHGSEFTLALIGSALIVLMALGSMVVSGHLPPRGLVSGDVRAGRSGPAPQQQVIFERIDGPDIVTVRTDATGHFSTTLPPGQYYVEEAIAACPRTGTCEPRRDFFPYRISIFTIAAGQHVDLQLGTCGDIWQCPR